MLRSMIDPGHERYQSKFGKLVGVEQVQVISIGGASVKGKASGRKPAVKKAKIGNGDEKDRQEVDVAAGQGKIGGDAHASVNSGGGEDCDNVGVAPKASKRRSKLPAALKKKRKVTQAERSEPDNELANDDSWEFSPIEE